MSLDIKAECRESSSPEASDDPSSTDYQYELQCFFCQSTSLCKTVASWEKEGAVWAISSFFQCPAVEEALAKSPFCSTCMEDIRKINRLGEALKLLQTEAQTMKSKWEVSLRLAVSNFEKNTDDGQDECRIQVHDERKQVLQQMVEKSMVLELIETSSGTRNQQPSSVLKSIEVSSQSGDHQGATGVNSKSGIQPEPTVISSGPGKQKEWTVHESNIVSVTAYLEESDDNDDDDDSSGSDDGSSADNCDSSGASSSSEGTDSESSVPSSLNKSKRRKLLVGQARSKTRLTIPSRVSTRSAAARNKITLAKLPEEPIVKNKSASKRKQISRSSRNVDTDKTDDSDDDVHKCPVVDCQLQFNSRRHKNDHVMADHLMISRPYNCSVCSTRFTTKDGRDKHEGTHQGNDTACTLCGKSCKSLQTLARHLRKHMSPGPKQPDFSLVCEHKDCRKVFHTRPQYIDHIRVEHLNMPQTIEFYDCSQCRSKFNNLEDLEDHKNVHLGVNPYTCSLCPEETKFPTKKELEKHVKLQHTLSSLNCIFCYVPLADVDTYKEHLLRWHMDEDRFVCEGCGDKFRKEASLNKHIQENHPDIKLNCLTCTICNKTFKNRRGLNYHVRNHAGEYRFLCDVCSYGTMYSSHMRKHMETHNTDLKYACNLCEQKYNTRDTLRSHIRRVHDLSKAFACDGCQRRFAKEQLLKNHKIKCQGSFVGIGRKVTCPHCFPRRSFKFEAGLEKHLKVAHAELLDENEIAETDEITEPLNT